MGEQFRVLIIEDNEDDAELVMRFVRQYCKNAFHKRVDKESEILKSLSGEKWDLVISDYNLPAFTGMDVIKIFKDAEKETPLIIVSGMIGEETAIETVKAGATDYVLKSNLGRLPVVIERAVIDLDIRQKMQKMHQNLIQSQKMESVGRFAGGLAHDVNNVLTAITLYGEMALKHLHKEPEEAEKNILALLESKKTAADIIKQLLLFSRKKNQLSISIIDLCHTLNKFAPLLRRLIDLSIELKINTPAEPLFIMANPTQIEQILLNLAINARDAMANGGVLEITLARQEMTSPRPMHILVDPGEYVVLTVKDSGHGMSEEVSRQIFEPYFSTKPDHIGTGLGLSVIYGIVQLLKGGILVESIPEVGTSFNIYFHFAEYGGSNEFR